MKKILVIALLGLVLAGCQKIATDSVEPSTDVYNTNNNASDQNQAVNADQPMPPQQIEPVISADEAKVTQATIKTSLGSIKIKFYNQDSPKTVGNFVNLAKRGFYNGTKFHRVIKDFMIQAGDPLSANDAVKDQWGTGGPGYQFNDEFNSHKLVRGSIAMANAGPNTNGSQFFIVTATSTPWLDGHHTNFGEVVAGMDVVDKIQNVKTEGPDRPVTDVVIESITTQ